MMLYVWDKILAFNELATELDIHQAIDVAFDKILGVLSWEGDVSKLLLCFFNEE